MKRFIHTLLVRLTHCQSAVIVSFGIAMVFAPPVRRASARHVRILARYWRLPPAFAALPIGPSLPFGVWFRRLRARGEYRRRHRRPGHSVA